MLVVELTSCVGGEISKSFESSGWRAYKSGSKQNKVDRRITQPSL